MTTTTTVQGDKARRNRKDRPQQQFFGTTDIARMTGLHRTTIWRRVRQGVLPEPRNVLGQKRWHISDLQVAGVDFTEIPAAA